MPLFVKPDRVQRNLPRMFKVTAALVTAALCLLVAASLLAPTHGPLSAPDATARRRAPEPLTVVLLTHFDDVARALISLASVRLHLAPELLKEVLVICPWEESLVLRHVAEGSWLHSQGTAAALGSTASPAEAVASPVQPALPRVRVVAETTLLNVTRAQFSDVKPYNYRLQMLLKLTVSSIVTTRFYLVLDSDVVMARHVDVAQAHWLFPQPGKAIYHPTRRQAHASWWSQTEATIGLQQCLPQDLGAKLFGVTPAVLATDIARATVQHLVRHFGGHMQALRVLLPYGKPFWTEYCAYHLVACKLGNFDRYHAPRQGAAPRLYKGLWRRQAGGGVVNMSSLHMQPCEDCLFMVLQSNLALPERRVVADLEALFATPPPGVKTTTATTEPRQ